ncbi:MAG: HAD family hydrolase [Gemmiger sp.]|nr:HAD family hydrolase [Gemmiger sp.]
MQENKIKIVASDLDGTLLQYGKKKIEGEIFAQIRALAAHGIRFCPASGRQYTSLRALFAPVAEDCIFLCENGGVIYQNEQVLAKTPMPRALAEEIAWDFWQGSDGRGEVMLSGENCAYLMTRGSAMLERIRFIGNRYQIIEDPATIPEEIVKVSVYLREGVDPYVARFVPKWQQANAAVAGPYWIDTTMANKGTGIEGICRALGIGPENVMAFGDNYNDVAMLDKVGCAYIMESAAPALRQRYPHHTPRPEDALRAFLKGLEAVPQG